MINTIFFFIFVDMLQANKGKHAPQERKESCSRNILKGMFKGKHRHYPTLHFCHCFLYHGLIWSQEQEEPQSHNSSQTWNLPFFLWELVLLHLLMAPWHQIVVLSPLLSVRCCPLVFVCRNCYCRVTGNLKHCRAEVKILHFSKARENHHDKPAACLQLKDTISVNMAH